MSKTIPCPVCWHEETVRSAANGRPADHTGDTTARMFFRIQGAASGQQVTRGSGGWWLCEICGCALVPREAGTLLLAVFTVCPPDRVKIANGTFVEVDEAFSAQR